MKDTTNLIMVLEVFREVSLLSKHFKHQNDFRHLTLTSLCQLTPQMGFSISVYLAALFPSVDDHLLLVTCLVR